MKEYPIVLPLTDDTGLPAVSVNGITPFLVSGAGDNYLYLTTGDLLCEITSIKCCTQYGCNFSFALEVLVDDSEEETWMTYNEYELSLIESTSTKWSGFTPNHEFITKGMQVRLRVNASTETHIYLQIMGFK